MADTSRRCARKWGAVLQEDDGRSKWKCRTGVACDARILSSREEIDRTKSGSRNTEWHRHDGSSDPGSCSAFCSTDPPATTPKVAAHAPSAGPVCRYYVAITPSYTPSNVSACVTGVAGGIQVHWYGFDAGNHGTSVDVYTAIWLPIPVPIISIGAELKPRFLFLLLVELSPVTSNYPNPRRD